jgi:hypothetical protein
MTASLSDHELTEFLGMCAHMLKSVADRWRLRMQAGRLGSHPASQVLAVIDRLELAARHLEPEPVRAPEEPEGALERRAEEVGRDSEEERGGEIQELIGVGDGFGGSIAGGKEGILQRSEHFIGHDHLALREGAETKQFSSDFSGALCHFRARAIERPCFARQTPARMPPLTRKNHCGRPRDACQGNSGGQSVKETRG